MTEALIARANPEGPSCLFSLANWKIKSNVVLPELEQTAGRHDWRFHASLSSHVGSESYVWFNHWSGKSGVTWLALGRARWGYVLRFPDLADFRVYTEERLIVCSHFKIPPETIRHLLLDQVFPLVLSQGGSVAIHASAVATHDGAIVFAARCGTGKSTLASYLSRTGWQVITDDCLLITEEDGTLVGRALYPGVRLLDDSVRFLLNDPTAVAVRTVSPYSRKIRFNIHDSALTFERSALPIKRICFVEGETNDERNSQPAITEVTSKEAFLELLKFTFLLDVDDSRMLKRSFEQLHYIACHLSFRKINYPQRWDVLPKLRKMLERDLIG